MSEAGSVSAFSFSGRISRSSFWAVIGVMILTVIVIGVLAAVTVPQFVKSGGAPSTDMPTWLTICLVILYAIALWLNFANYAKRLHDMDHSAWLSLALLIPLVNLIMLIYCGAKEGTAGPNRFGAGPVKVTI